MWPQAERQFEEYQGMKGFILVWTEKAEALVHGNINWNSALQLQEQIRAHQVIQSPEGEYILEKSLNYCTKSGRIKFGCFFAQKKKSFLFFNNPHNSNICSWLDAQ